MPPLFLMDVTLRDGAYFFQNQFSAEMVKNVASCLDEAGIPFIELGHGISVGAHEKVTVARETDLAYAEAARSAVRKARIGMIALPSLATPHHLDLLRPFLDFIRIGASIDQVEGAAPLVRHAKKIGYQVFFQMVQSSGVSTTQVIESARKVQGMGVEAIYLVDSAGAWSPWEVAPVIREVRKVIATPLGFHAHNHLGTALANSLIAIEEGCQWVDASLRGIGRGAGNVQMELLLIHLQRKKLVTGIDLGTVETASRLIEEEMPTEKRGIGREEYLAASQRMVLYPWSLYQRIAETCGLQIEDLAKSLQKTVKTVEIQPDDLLRAVKSLGADPNLVSQILQKKGS